MRKLALCFTLAFVLSASTAAVARAAGVYVALGDSYTSAPLVPNQHGEPIDCGRSDHNYPSLVAGALGAGTFVDVSCGSAETRHMTEPQTGLPAGGTNPPQFNALRTDATLVTVGIGGNDAGLVGVAQKCAELGLLDPMGTSCRDFWAPGGNDQVVAKIAATAPRIVAVLQGIHQRSPSARVAIVGYPDVLPQNGGSCWPMVPLSPDDVRYIDGLIVRINAMIADQAAANGALYVDTYADSVGHDVCKLPPERWFEGLVPTQPAYPMHPNEQGEASMARSVMKALGQPAAGIPAAPPSGVGRRSAACLSRSPAVRSRSIGRVRLRATRRGLARRVRVHPARRSRLAQIWCTRGGTGRVAAVFSKRSRAGRTELVLTTARSRAFRGAYPRRERIAKGLFFASRRSNRLIWRSRGKTVFVAVMTKRVRGDMKRLGRDLRLALR